MVNLGENCKFCLCAKCEYQKTCGKMGGDTEQWCEDDCLGEGNCIERCSDYEKER